MTEQAAAPNRALSVPRRRPSGRRTSSEIEKGGSKRVAPPLSSIPVDLRTWKGKRDGALIAILYGTGMLGSEVVRLRLDDISLRDGTAFFTIIKPQHRSRASASRVARLFWPETYLPYIMQYLDWRSRQAGRKVPHGKSGTSVHGDTANPYLFPGRHKGGMATRNMRALTDTYLSTCACWRVASGIVKANRHDIRAAFARATEAILDPDALCDQLGIARSRGRMAKCYPFALKRSRATGSAQRTTETKEFRQQIIVRDRRHCLCCGYRVKGKNAALDHIDPQGPTEPCNLQLLCTACNTWKGDRYIIDFRSLWERLGIELPRHD
jgi:hypothetical protein